MLNKLYQLKQVKLLLLLALLVTRLSLQVQCCNDDLACKMAYIGGFDFIKPISNNEINACQEKDR